MCKDNIDPMIPIQLSARLQYGLHESFVVFLPMELDDLFSKTRDVYKHHSVFEKVNNQKKNNDADYFFNLLQMGVRSGLAATYYNLLTFKEYTKELREKAEKIVKTFRPSQPISVGFTVDKLIYEYEHFTLHSRILLDRCYSQSKMSGGRRC